MHTSTISRVLVSGSFALIAGALYLGTALPAEAQLVRNATNASTTVPRIDMSCVSEAVEVREDALIEAWDNYQDDISDALTTRKTALIAAWNEDTIKDRNAALKTAWKNWRASNKAAHTELRKERKAAWDAFKKTVKSKCNVHLPKDEALDKNKNDTIAL